ncbi:hypothetical protein TPB0596_46530 [Tsukamurella pulmonis]|uniref:hypothetical protein n=1 Tax=Tsukamurella pulmonis TaxID=47312 RepID=UPI001EDF8D9C|nr:hypothetical protein [Tsukamurella pulmonis]BDD84890.1 hypothetical protein TPB0596_46530 [Tsukamurella pulmonis]
MTTIAAHGGLGGTAGWVAEAVKSLWVRSSESAELQDNLVMVPRLRCAELVVDEEASLEEQRAHVDQLIDSGFKVSVLVPLRQLGRAHSVFRGCDLSLQGWTYDDGDILHFLDPELP